MMAREWKGGAVDWKEGGFVVLILRHPHDINDAKISRARLSPAPFYRNKVSCQHHSSSEQNGRPDFRRLFSKKKKKKKKLVERIAGRGPTG